MDMEYAARHKFSTLLSMNMNKRKLGPT